MVLAGHLTLLDGTFTFRQKGLTPTHSAKQCIAMQRNAVLCTRTIQLYKKPLRAD